MIDLAVTVAPEGDEVVVAVGGDLDYETHPRLEDAVRDALARLPDGGGLVVDLAAVTYCDSCGLRVLVGASRRAQELGARFRVRGAQGQTARALTLTGLDQVLGETT